MKNQSFLYPPGSFSWVFGVLRTGRRICNVHYTLCGDKAMNSSPNHPREFSGSILVIEDREASLVAKYAFAEPRYWATANQAMRATDSAPAVT
jgi:hypothetical protein